MRLEYMPTPPPLRQIRLAPVTAILGMHFSWSRLREERPISGRLPEGSSGALAGDGDGMGVRRFVGDGAEPVARDPGEGLDHRRVELRAAAAEDLGARLGDRHRTPVRAVAR